ncbi:MAG: tetratricopeptide repeat protein [Cyanobacteria bacterium SZAS-4]|nr:tetratricopeptide repeat protein [Cyanobacteria bacterium SZAS-4]
MNRIIEFSMRQPILLNKTAQFASFALLAAVVSSLALPHIPAEAVASKSADADEMTKKAVTLFDANKFEEAIDLENQAIKKSPTYWLPHSALSIFEWQRNQFDVAVKEAQEAAKLAPDNELANLNYAQMNQQMGYYDTAIPAFKKAIKVAPNSSAPRIGLSQSLIASARAAEALEVLNEMSKAESGDFNWWHKLSISFAQMHKPKQAADAAEKAVAAASTAEQKSQSGILQLVELIRANEIDRARAIEDDVLRSKPKDDQVYVKSLSALCAATDPACGKNLLNLAIENGLSSSDGYYKLGAVLEQKSETATIDSNTRAAWLDLAELAYRQAVKAAPSEAKFYLALAGIFDRKGKTDEMVAELLKAKSFDNTDVLASYLVSRVKTADNDLAGRLREKLVGAPEKPYQLNLAKAEFSVENLQCLCKLNVLEYELKKQSGIECAAITHREKPIKGVLLVDQSFGTKEAFANVGKKQSVTLQVVSSEPVSTVNEAIKFAQNIRDTGQPSNVWSFVIDLPKMPTI